MRLFVMTPIITCVGVAGLALFPAPAQAAPSEKVLIIYGNERCPTSNGQQIVVCARRPESEKYRIPKELRQLEKSAAAQSWAARSGQLEYVGKSGVQSCSATGGGGDTGCMADLFKKARDERRAEGKDPLVDF